MWPACALTSSGALHQTTRLIALAVLLQTLELLWVQSAFRKDGSFPWSVLRRDLVAGSRWRARVLDALLAERPFVALLWLQLGLAIGLLGWGGALLPLLLLASVLLVQLRFRGGFNGGSDAMTIVVLAPLCFARIVQTLGGADVWLRAALGYIAAQLTLSYFVAGLSKLRSASWRRGSALAQLVQVRQYYVPPLFRRALANLWLSRLVGWLVLLFELSAPLTLLLGTRFVTVWLALALLFHIVIASMLGLNRFVWAWLAAYPALLYFRD